MSLICSIMAEEQRKAREELERIKWQYLAGVRKTKSSVW